MTNAPAPYRPDSADLLRTVADFLTDLGPRLEPGDRYTALVCTHILNMLTRERASTPHAQPSEAPLAAAIRAGARDADWDVTFSEVLQSTVQRVKIVKPEHLAEKHRQEK